MNKKQEEREDKIILNAIYILSLSCAGSPEIIIKKLEGYLFTDKEADRIIKTMKKQLGCHHQ